MKEARTQLLKANTEKIEHAYAQALRDGIVDPVVVALDLNDPFARKIAATETSEQETDRQIANARSNGVNPSALFAISTTDAMENFKEFRSTRSILSGTPGPGRFRVAVVQGGTLAWVTWKLAP